MKVALAGIVTVPDNVSQFTDGVSRIGTQREDQRLEFSSLSASRRRKQQLALRLQAVASIPRESIRMNPAQERSPGPVNRDLDRFLGGRRAERFKSP